MFVFISGLLFFAYGQSDAFVIHTEAYVEGNMSVDMGVSKGTGAQQRRYELEVDSTDGTTFISNNYEGGETGVDISYVADPDGGLFGGSLSAKEEIGVNTCNGGAYRLGAAGSFFDVKELLSSSQGDFDAGTYKITAEGDGKFGTNAAEKVSTPNPSVSEKNVYELKGEGVFGLSGEYGFRGDVEEDLDPLSGTSPSSGMTSEEADIPEQSLSISGPSSVTENTTANYTATLTSTDGTSEDVTQTASWGEDASFAYIDSNGALSALDVDGDQAVTITAFLTSENVTQTAEMVVTILDTNLPPSNPAILTPYDGETDCELDLSITTEPFSDPDGDAHGQSRWQISQDTNFDASILDMTSTQQLTELTVPAMLLEVDTLYYVRVRFYDAFLEPSGWSDTIGFTTTAESPPQYTLSITGPTTVMENTTANYTATITSTDGTSEDVTETASWGEDASYANIDSNGALSTSEVMDDQTVTITAFYTHDGVTSTGQSLVAILDSNLPPLKPVIVTPHDGQIDCELQLFIQTEPFSDPDANGHGQSQWQISKDTNFDAPTFDVTSTQELIEITVPDMLLEPDTVYYVRVRFYDAFLKPSFWSDTIQFTTIAQSNPPSTSDTPDPGDLGDDVPDIAGSDPDNTGNTMVAYNNGIAVDYGPLGVWHYDGTHWTQLGGEDPQWLCVYDQNLVGDYGSSGLWQYDGFAWSQVRDDDADNTGNTMVAYNNGIAVDYGPLGLWHFDGTDWSLLGELDPEWLCVYGENSDRLVGDYGDSGVWEYDGVSWSQLRDDDADNTGNTMVAYNNGIAVDYGPLGLWYYDGNDWSQLGTVDPEWLCAYSDKLVGDYGTDYGLKQYDGASWSRLRDDDPDNTGNAMVAYNNGIAVDYGPLGLWHFDGTDWSLLGELDPEWLSVYGNNLVGDYGSLSVLQDSTESSDSDG